MATCRDRHIRQPPATLHGYQRLAVKDEEYPAAIPNPTNNITGLLYLDVSPQDLARLDDFEGEYYERFSITVVISESEHITAEVYILNPRYRNTVEMFEWDVVRFKEVGIGRFISRYQGFDQL